MNAARGRSDDDAPRCDRCGLPLTTGLMAVFCERRDKCEFWPEDAEGQEFVRELRGDMA